jgi:hypothetical protein
MPRGTGEASMSNSLRSILAAATWSPFTTAAAALALAAPSTAAVALASAAPQGPGTPVLIGGGTFQSTRAVEFHAEDGVAVHYTTDGSDPTMLSPLAVVPLLLTNTAEIKARAFDASGNASPVATTYVTNVYDHWLGFDCNGRRGLVDRFVRTAPARCPWRERSGPVTVFWVAESSFPVEATGSSSATSRSRKNQLTFSAWIRPDSFGVQDARILSKADGVQDANHSFMVSTIQVGNQTRLRFRLRTNGSTTTLIANSGVLQAGRWQHVCARYDGANMSLYLDGELVGSTPKSGPVDATGEQVWIGNNPVTADRGFDGRMDQLFVFDRALSDLEIRGMAADLGQPGIRPTGRGTLSCDGDIPLELVSRVTTASPTLTFAGAKAPANTHGLLLVSGGPMFGEFLFGVEILVDLADFLAFPFMVDASGFYEHSLPIVGAPEDSVFYAQALFLNLYACPGGAIGLSSNGLEFTVVAPDDLGALAQDPGGSGGSGANEDPPVPDPNPGIPEDPDDPNVVFDFFVDANAGSNSNAGTENAPWQTLAHALAAAPAGSFVGVRDGNYGTLGETSANRTGFVTLKAVPGASPRLNNVSLNYSSMSNSFICIDGFQISSVGQSNVIYMRRARNVQFKNCEIRAEKWAVNRVGRDGLDIVGCQNVLVQRCYIHEVYRGGSVADNDTLVLRRNLIRPKQGTGIQYRGGNSNGTIEFNHIWGDTNYSSSDPDAIVGPHASMISFRSGDVIVAGNHMHGMGSSSGMMFYEPDVAGGEAAYSNILLENNVVYNVRNTYALRIYNLGSNVVIRNNLFFSRLRTGSCGGQTPDNRYRYSTSVIVHNVAPGHSATTLGFYNNICMGMVTLPDNLDERNNIIWAWGPGNWRSTSPSGTSTIVTAGFGGCGNAPTFFEGNGFFSDVPNLFFPNASLTNWQLLPNSPAINFGHPAYQPERSVGSIGPDGFVRDDGVLRSETRHNAGPFQY